ncbi:hypothetical protein D9M72_580820 [compost metagenome]
MRGILVDSKRSGGAEGGHLTVGFLLGQGCQSPIDIGFAVLLGLKDAGDVPASHRHHGGLAGFEHRPVAGLLALCRSISQGGAALLQFQGGVVLVFEEAVLAADLVTAVLGR